MTASPAANAAYYPFPDNHRLPWWRRAGGVLAISGLHLGGLLFAFGMTARSPRPPSLPLLEVRVVQAAPSPANVAPKPVPSSRPPARQVARPWPVSPVVKAPPAKTIAANTRQAPALTAIEQPARPTEKSPAPVTAVAPATASVPPVASHPPALRPARFDADYLHNPAPKYPETARRLGQEGRVVLSVRVSAQGTPLTIDIRQSSGFSRLDEAARAAVAHWRFVPARRGDEAVDASVLVPLQFRLDD